MALFGYLSRRRTSTATAPEVPRRGVLQIRRLNIPTRADAMHRPRRLHPGEILLRTVRCHAGVSDAQRNHIRPSAVRKTAACVLRSTQAGPAGCRLAPGTQSDRMRADGPARPHRQNYRAQSPMGTVTTGAHHRFQNGASRLFPIGYAARDMLRSIGFCSYFVLQSVSVPFMTNLRQSTR